MSTFSSSEACPDCGAKLQIRESGNARLSCSYCGNKLKDPSLVRSTSRLICAAEFSQPNWGGWRHGSDFTGTIEAGVWSLCQKSDEQNHPLLVAPGAYDDFDIEVDFRLTASQPRDAFFIRARGGSQGAMIAMVWQGGQVALTWQQPEHQWRSSIARSPAPSVEPSAWQRLRWTAQGPKHKLYLDGRLTVSATHSEILGPGFLDLRVQAQTTEVQLAIRQISLYEAAP